MPRFRAKGSAPNRITCDCGRADCDAPPFVSYSFAAKAGGQAEADGWRVARRGRDRFWLAPGHRCEWDRQPVTMGARR